MLYKTGTEGFANSGLEPYSGILCKPSCENNGI